MSRVSLWAIDLQGNVKWNRQIDLGSFGFTYFLHDLCVAKDGESYLMAIYKVPVRYGTYTATILKCYNVVDESLLWETELENVRIFVVLPSEEEGGGGGGYYVAGRQDFQPWFAKLDSLGEVVWSHTYRQNVFFKMRFSFLTIVPTSDGGFLLGGGKALEDGGWVVKTDGNGRELWRWKHDHKIGVMVEVGDGQCLAFSCFDISCLSASGKTICIEPFSKYIADFEGLDINTFKDLQIGANEVRVDYVSSFTIDSSGSGGGAGVKGDSVVVAVRYRTIDTHTYNLWVGGFTVKSSFFDDNSGKGLMFWCGITIALAVVVVVVGWLVYNLSKKHGFYSVVS
jgi:hypothetical protein